MSAPETPEPPVPTTEPRPLTEQDPAAVPLYTVGDVVRYLRRPPWWPSPELAPFPPHPELVWLFDDLPRPARDGAASVSFREFAELYVRSKACDAVIKRAPAGATKRRDWFGLWGAVRSSFRDSGGWIKFFGAGTDEAVVRVLDAFHGRVGGPEHVWLKDALALHLNRVELDGGEPVRLFPFSREPAADAPRVVVMDPRVRFGRPTLAGRGVPTDILFERFPAGDSVADLADDYGVTAAEVEEAVRFEAGPPAPGFPDG